MRSGIYTYLSGISAMILLGAFVRSLFQNPDLSGQKLKFVPFLPAIAVAAIYTGFMIGQSIKWIAIEKTTATVLNQIASQHPKPASNIFFILKYKDRDAANFFPDGFEAGEFAPALRLHYSDPGLDGKIIQQDEPIPSKPNTVNIQLLYLPTDDRSFIIKTEAVEDSLLSVLFSYQK